MSLVSDERVQELLMKEAFLEKLLPRLREEIIEECAKVVDKCAAAEQQDHPSGVYARGILRNAATAIRALKDKK